ncbi:hypothetical protein NFI00_000106 [Salmonella enterica]|nr:hypothetical protein [Salmonella enterica]
MNELNKLYSAMWKSWNGVIKDDGRMVLSMEGTDYPIRIDEMDMYLPLSEVLEGQTMGKVFFHPACENITSKETEVFKVIRKITVMRLLTMFKELPVVLMEVATRKTKKTWRQDILDLLDPLSNVKKPVRDELKNLFTRMHIEIENEGVDNRFIHFKVSKGGGRSRTSGEKVYYKTKPSFPFYNELVKKLARSEGMADNQTVEVNNFSVSRAALKVAVDLFQGILPAVTAPDDYEFEATQPVAARLTSYLLCYAEIAEQMNRLQNNFRADFDKAGIYPIDVSWVEHLENLPDIYRQVPQMDYNSHNTQEETGAVNQGNLSNMLSFTSSQSQQPQQQQHTQQQQVTNQMAQAQGFDTTAPMMQPGDDYQNFEIDYNTNSVMHYARNRASGVTVLYRCSRRGNLIERRELYPQQNGMMGGMNAMNGMMGFNGMMMMPNGMMIMQPMSAPTAGTVVNSVAAGGYDSTPAMF